MKKSILFGFITILGLFTINAQYYPRYETCPYYRAGYERGYGRGLGYGRGYGRGLGYGPRYMRPVTNNEYPTYVNDLD